VAFLRYGKNPRNLGWHEVCKTLYESLPPGTVEFGKKYKRYKEDNDGIRVIFEVNQLL
jgi:hypothetical protein